MVSCTKSKTLHVIIRLPKTAHCLPIQVGFSSRWGRGGLNRGGGCVCSEEHWIWGWKIVWCEIVCVVCVLEGCRFALLCQWEKTGLEITAAPLTIQNESNDKRESHTYTLYTDTSCVTLKYAKRSFVVVMPEEGLVGRAPAILPLVWYGL